MNDLILTHDHSEIDETLAETREAIAAVEITTTYAALDLFYARLAMHIRAENVHLFPALQQAATTATETLSATAPSGDEVQQTIASLRHDHDYFMSTLAGMMKTLRDYQRGKVTEALDEVLASVEQGLDGVEARLRQHNELEETRVYHWAEQLLSSAQQSELAAHIDKELANLPARFKAEA